MAGIGPEGEPSRDALPAFQGKRSEQADPQQGRPADALQPPVFQEGQSWQDRSHEELVMAFRQAIWQKNET